MMEMKLAEVTEEEVQKPINSSKNRRDPGSGVDFLEKKGPNPPQVYNLLLAEVGVRTSRPKIFCSMNRRASKLDQAVANSNSLSTRLLLDRRLESKEVKFVAISITPRFSIAPCTPG